MLLANLPNAVTAAQVCAASHVRAKYLDGKGQDARLTSQVAAFPPTAATITMAGRITKNFDLTFSVLHNGDPRLRLTAGQMSVPSTIHISGAHAAIAAILCSTY